MVYDKDGDSEVDDEILKDMRRDDPRIRSKEEIEAMLERLKKLTDTEDLDIALHSVALHAYLLWVLGRDEEEWWEAMIQHYEALRRCLSSFDSLLHPLYAEEKEASKDDVC